MDKLCLAVFDLYIQW